MNTETIDKAICRNREGVVIPIGKAFATVLRFDWGRDEESWSWHATLAVQGDLPGDADGWDVTAIQNALAAVLPLQGAGNGGAGQPFANEPWLQFFGEPCRTMLVSQSGGLDV